MRASRPTSSFETPHNFDFVLAKTYSYPYLINLFIIYTMTFLVPDFLSSRTDEFTSMDMNVSRSRTSSEGSIVVEVSASRFNIVPSLFKKVQGLPWFEHKGVRHLNSSPDVFEALLQYFLFDSLPDTSSLAEHEVLELTELASSLRSTESLLRHLETSKRLSRISPESSSSSISSKSGRFSFVASRKKSRNSLYINNNVAGSSSKRAERTTSDRTIYPFAISQAIPQLLDENGAPSLIQTASTESDITPSFDMDDMTISTRQTCSTKGSRSSRARKSLMHQVVVPNQKASKRQFKGMFKAKKVSHFDWCAGFDFVV
jgi:hypothetical protein